MPGWVTRVTYGPALTAQYNELLPQQARERVIHFPYKLVAGVATLDTWAVVKAEILSSGEAPRWCRLEAPLNPDLNIPGASWYAGSIPDIPPEIEEPIVVDEQYKADLISTGSDFLSLLRNPEWENFCARFQQLTPDQIDDTPVFQASLEISSYLGLLWK